MLLSTFYMYVTELMFAYWFFFKSQVGWLVFLLSESVMIMEDTLGDFFSRDDFFYLLS